MKILLLVLLFIPALCSADEHLTCWSGGVKVIDRDIKGSTLKQQAWYVTKLDGTFAYVKADCLIEEMRK